MLAAIANPLDPKDTFKLDPVAVEEEVKALSTSLADARTQGLVSLTVLPGRTGLSSALKTQLVEEGVGVIDGSLTLDHLLRHLPGHHVLHLISYGAYNPPQLRGEGKGMLFLEQEDDTCVMVQDSLFVSSLAQIVPLPQLVFLVTCESSRRDTADGRPFVGVGPKLVEAGVPAVVAMQDRVSMTTTRQLAADFYSLLFRHQVVDQVMNEARNLLRSRERSDWSVPVLFMRLREGRLFAVKRAEPEDLEAMLSALVRKRILRRHVMEGQVLYEMAHEYLVPQIMKWIDREEMPVKQAEELLAREMASWRVYGSSLIPTQRLSYLYPTEEQLGLLSQPEMPAALKLEIWETLDQRSDLLSDTLVDLSTGPHISPELKLKIWEALDQRSDLPADTLVSLLAQLDMPAEAKLTIWQALDRRTDLPTETAVGLLADPGLPARVRSGIADNLSQRGVTRPSFGVADDGQPDIAWCAVLAGRFVMGEGENERELLLQPFAISKYPITNAQYETFVQDGGYTEKWRHCWTEAGWSWKRDKQGPITYGGAFDLPDHPVVGVSWYEAQAFTCWLSEKLGMEIFLPSEAQWEKAARSSDGRRYPWGEEITPNHANYKGTGIQNTNAVGIFPKGASPYGVLDMSGSELP